MRSTRKVLLFALMSVCASPASNYAAGMEAHVKLVANTVTAGAPVEFEFSPGLTEAAARAPSSCEVIDRATGVPAVSAAMSDITRAIVTRSAAGDATRYRLPPLPAGSYELRLPGAPPVFFGVLPVVNTPTAPDAFFAINDHRYTAEDFAAYMRFGFVMKRDLVTRSSVQLSATRFDWAPLDQRLDLLRQTQTRASLIAAYTPGWDRPASSKKSAHIPPTDAAAFDRYLAEISKRASTDLVPIFEIWNEPNSVDFFRGSAETYASLLKRAYLVSKQASPTRIVHMGGIAGFDWEFIDRLEQSGALAYTDALAIHPYAWNESDRWLWEQLDRLVRWRDRTAEGLPIFCNEWGIEADGAKPAQLKNQAERVVRQTTLLRAAGVAVSGYYLWTQGSFRLVESDRAPRPAGIAQCVISNRLSGSRYLGRVPLGSQDDFVFAFEQNNRPFLIAWTQNHQASIPAAALTGNSRVFDLYGQPVDHAAAQPVTLSASPLFIEAIAPSTLASLTTPSASQETILRSNHVPPPGWIEFRYPKGSQILPLARQFQIVEMRIHNTTTGPLNGRLLPVGNDAVEFEPSDGSGQTIPPGEDRAFQFKIRSRANASDAARVVTIDSRLGEKNLPPLRIRTRACEGPCWEFVANSFEDSQNRASAKNVKTAPGRLWTTGPDGEVVWQFDLRAHDAARVEAQTSPRRPPPSSFRFSGDGKNWVELTQTHEDKTAWDCSRFAGGTLYVRYTSGETAHAALHKLTVYADARKTS